MSKEVAWVALNRTKYRLKWDNRLWFLEATPKGKYPWLLRSRPDDAHYREQALGAPDLHAAQRQAEMWLSLQYIDDLISRSAA